MQMTGTKANLFTEILFQDLCNYVSYRKDQKSIKGKSNERIPVESVPAHISSPAAFPAFI
jgi:hypothetical protein